MPHGSAGQRNTPFGNLREAPQICLGAKTLTENERTTGAPLEDHYRDLESRHAPVRDADYERLVVPTGNADEPVHRWFHMKEAYSPYLFPRVLKDLSLSDAERLRVHDPFLGSGTTLASAMLADDGPVVDGSGTEVNPFLGLLASTKLAALALDAKERAGLRLELREQSRNLLRRASSAQGDPQPAPSLAAFTESKYFPPQQLSGLLHLRDQWSAMSPGLCKDLIGIALGSAVEPCSALRRDGRALRYERAKKLGEPRAEFQKRVSVIVADLESIDPRGTSKVCLTDGLQQVGWPRAGTADLVCFSPPYPNNIDYTEVYKLEAWFLGLIADADGFRAQRARTMRSHPSLKFSDRVWTGVPADLLTRTADLAKPIIDAVPGDRYRHQRERVARGFLEDCAVVLYRSFNSLKPGGAAVYAVGNSRHGMADAQYTIASDVLMAEIATFVGFSVEGVRVARDLHRRGRHDHLRESVVFLRKPSTL